LPADRGGRVRHHKRQWGVVRYAAGVGADPHRVKGFVVFVVIGLIIYFALAMLVSTLLSP
jgi:hypothetical protein